MYFEDSLKKIEDILEQLESGKLSLENALILYNQGTEIANKCKIELNEARLQVSEKSVGDNDDTER